MAKFDRNQFITFSLDMHHIYRMNGTEYRFVYETNGTVTFSAVEDAHRKVTYEVGTLNRMNGAGQVEMVPYGLLPEHLRPAVVHDIDDVAFSGLPRAKRKRMETRHAMVQGYRALKSANAFKVNDAEINEAMDDICREAAAYLAMTLPDPEGDLKVRAWQAGEGPKPRSKSTVEIPDAVSARTLRKWDAAFERGGKKALLDNVDKQGNRNSYFSVEEMQLMSETINREYLNLQRKTIATVVADVRQAFRDENSRRAEEGQAPLRTPGREAVRQFIKRLDKFRVLVARFGQEQAMKRMRPTFKGLEVQRPLERVEMDEWKIDLLTILAKSGLMSMFNQEELGEMGLLDRMKRWWMCAAMDCRTNCFVGMSITANPQTSSAIKCLRMVVSDKGQFADKMGALAPWSMFGTPETLYVDNGSAFKSALFTTTCVELGITKVQTIAGCPAMRGKGEGGFNTLGVTLLPRLSGRTFGDVVEKADHPSEKRACLSIDDLIYTLVRWVVDVYHNTPQEALGGRTPLGQWEADLREGNYPLMPAPSQRRKRIAFGLPLERVLQKDGIRVLNVRYQSADLARHFLDNGVTPLNVRWFEEDIGVVEVELNGEWKPIDAVSDAFQGLDASTWIATRRAMRAKDPKRKEWEEDVIAQTIADIEALNADRKAAKSVIDHGWSEKRFAAAEKEAMASFEIVPPRQKTADSPDGYGCSVIPSEPSKPTRANPTTNGAGESDAGAYKFRD
ncbi:DDE-type integrase/transposase/recombinase [Thalassorhabdomicrobium marinisediminis]|uniref:Integrase n=1 Tax=Thalassorhabdomicrobium marinisediminis TaxID=2170577 RepID=A0A2T7FSX0_9RHOB|nr:DDE-type integrase/transposase/recombinase [Thalassorhabdomicrobium marinisediminis]PVA05271.1 integrase [Thalassorhabdomicrobium marinisediminis]